MTSSKRLAAFGFNVDVSWLAEIVLMGLPEHYESMIIGLEVSGWTMSADAVKSKTLHDVKVNRGQKGPKKSNFKKIGHFAANPRNHH